MTTYTPNPILPNPEIQHPQGIQYPQGIQSPQGVKPPQGGVPLPAGQPWTASGNPVPQKPAEPAHLVYGFPTNVKLALLFALLYTVCLYDNRWGVAIPFYTVGVCGGYLYLAKKFGVRMKPLSWFYMAATVLLGISTCLTMNGVILWWNAVGRVLLLILVILHNSYEDQMWSFFKYIGSMVLFVGYSIGNVGKPFTHFEQYRKSRGQTKNRKLLYVLMGVTIALPLLLIVMLLLASADVTFRQMTRDLFRNLFYAHHIWWILLTLLCAFFGGYGALCAIAKKKIKEPVKEGRDKEPLVGVTITLPLALLYLLFCLIQIINMVTAGALLPAEYTYAEYAREGFFQLLLVCLLNICLVVLFTQLFRGNVLLKILLTVISGCTCIMTVSSAQRMILYIRAYDLTRLRLMVLVALCGIALVLAGVFVSIYRKRFPLFRYAVIVVTVLYVILSFSSMDRIIARYNLAYGTKEEALELAYYEASMDAADLYREAYEKADDTEEGMQFGMYYLDKCKDEYEQIYGTDGDLDIRKFNVSAYRMKQ